MGSASSMAPTTYRLVEGTGTNRKGKAILDTLPIWLFHSLSYLHAGPHSRTSWGSQGSQYEHSSLTCLPHLTTSLGNTPWKGCHSPLPSGHRNHFRCESQTPRSGTGQTKRERVTQDKSHDYTTNHMTVTWPPITCKGTKQERSLKTSLSYTTNHMTVTWSTSHDSYMITHTYMYTITHLSQFSVRARSSGLGIDNNHTSVWCNLCT